MKTPANKE